MSSKVARSIRRGLTQALAYAKREAREDDYPGPFSAHYLPQAAIPDLAARVRSRSITSGLECRGRMRTATNANELCRRPPESYPLRATEKAGSSSMLIRGNLAGNSGRHFRKRLNLRRKSPEVESSPGHFFLIFQ